MPHRFSTIEAAVAGIRKMGNEDSHGMASPGMFDLAERLIALAPGDISRVDIALNGTEAGYFLPQRIDTGRYRAAWAMGVQDATGAALPAPRSTDPDNPSLDSDGKGRTQRDSAGLRMVVRVDTLAAARIRARSPSSWLGVPSRTLRM